jgi:hypothetical protein
VLEERGGVWCPDISGSNKTGVQRLFEFQNSLDLHQQEVPQSARDQMTQDRESDSLECGQILPQSGSDGVDLRGADATSSEGQVLLVVVDESLERVAQLLPNDLCALRHKLLREMILLSVLKRRVRQRQTERETETERQREREGQRQRDRDRETERERERETDRERDRERYLIPLPHPAL